jgi:putative FmdB family regulatory protein
MLSEGDDMPIYEYRCEKCGQVNELLILGKQEQLSCKQCGSEDLTKLLSAHNTSSSLAQKFEPRSGGVLWDTQFVRHTRELLFRVGGCS